MPKRVIRKSLRNTENLKNDTTRKQDGIFVEDPIRVIENLVNISLSRIYLLHYGCICLDILNCVSSALRGGVVDYDDENDDDIDEDNLIMTLFLRKRLRQTRH